MSVFGRLLMPISLAPRGLMWVFDKVAEEADRELNDPVRLRAELMELQRRAATGELTDAQYLAREDRILARLDAIERRQEAERAAATGPAESGLPRRKPTAAARRGRRPRRRRP